MVVRGEAVLYYMIKWPWHCCLTFLSTNFAKTFWFDQMEGPTKWCCYSSRAAGGAEKVQRCPCASVKACRADCRQQTGISIVYSSATLELLKPRECNWTCLLLGLLYGQCTASDKSCSVVKWEKKEEPETWKAFIPPAGGGDNLEGISQRGEFMTHVTLAYTSAACSQTALVVLQTH